MMSEPAPSGSRRLRVAAGLLAAGARSMAAVEDELAALPTLVRPGDVCLDVGAKHGAYTLVFAAAAGPSGRVVAFEPLPGPRRVIRVGRAVIGGTTVEIVPVAVGADMAAAELLLPVRRGLPVPGRAFLARGSVGFGSNVEFTRHRRVPVDVTTLDAWWSSTGEGRVDVVKLDVEGAEAAVLAGGERLLRTWRPTLLVELEDRHLGRFGTTAREVLEGLTATGYRAAVLDGGVWCDVETPSSTRRNHLFVHVDRGRPGA